MIIIAVTIFLFVIYAGLIVYYRISWSQVAGFKRETSDVKSVTSITIIIPARNEEENIKNCLQSIMEQSYPKNLFEVIVIDDHSTDGTVKIIEEFSNQNVTLISLKD